MRATAVVTACLAGLVLAGCGSSVKGEPGPQPGPKLPAPAQFLSVDAARHSVTITLVAAYDGSNGGFNFDGYSRELMWVVPRGWTVRVLCENRGSLRHSCAVVSNSLATEPAFTGASTPNPRTGLRSGTKATFSFRASKVGTYRFACLVPGHEDARMWDVLKIVRRGKPRVVGLQGRA